MLQITSFDKNSIGKNCGLKKGDVITAFDGKKAEDMLDVAYYDCQENFSVTVSRGGNLLTFDVVKPAEIGLGLNFADSSYVEPRHCANKCKFCFVDQLPKGKRPTLYVKDDDWRLSFVSGNYVTLTNLSQSDVSRILERKYSPLYVSVHATNDDVRRDLLGNPSACEIMPLLRKFAVAGIKMQTQIVMCPGLNDGEVLKQSLADLFSLYPAVESVAVVPVGLTCYRQGLTEIAPVTKQIACDTLDLVTAFDNDCFAKNGEHFAFCSDEMYVVAERDFPPYEFYGDFNQIENGVGIVADFTDKFGEALSSAKRVRNKSFTVVTGVSASKVVNDQINLLKSKFPSAKVNVLTVENGFFGPSVTVSGLLVGADVATAVQNFDGAGDVILLPRVMLREIADVFLDDMTLKQFKKIVNKKVQITRDGYELVSAILE